MHRCSAFRSFVLGVPFVVTLLLGFAADAHAADSRSTDSGADASHAADTHDADAHSWWVFFADKGFPSVEAEDLALQNPGDLLTPRALARRTKVRGESPVDVMDLPVHSEYVRAVLDSGATERHQLRWFNAVTVNATDAQIEGIRNLPFVTRVRRVAQQRHDLREPSLQDRIPRVESGTAPRGGLDYGECSSQILPIQVDQLHGLGLSGAGVRIGVFDTGFRRTHTVFSSLNVVDEWDFVQGDANTANEGSDSSNQHNHGSYVLSILAGFDPGNLIGPAYGAEFLLAKTETLDSETPAEEDNWAAAAQWADSLGADIITTSLGYTDWYTWDDLDGDTATITIAADLAVANGITVFTSAGNSGAQSWFFIGPPADGDSVIAVGAVDSTGTISSFSSHGPTIDGRTKPDVCAMGSSTFFALASDNVSYARGSGTSFSCPLTAGVGALLLEGNPTWGPLQIREALRSTASRAGAPDNDYGWGVIQAFDALGYSTSAPLIAPRAGHAIRVSPNPSADVSSLRWSLPRGEHAIRLDLVDVTGRRIRELTVTDAQAGSGSVSWDGHDAYGGPVSTGIYFARLETNRGIHVSRVVRIR